MNKNLFLCGLMALCLTACQYNTPQMAITEEDVAKILEENNGRLYTIDELIDTFGSEEGNYTLSEYYRTRAHGTLGDYWLFNIDTLPDTDADGKTIYLRGRLATDDYGGNFYKTLILQQKVGDNDQRCLRLSVDIGSVGGLYQKGQEIMICCKGLSLGRYGNQEQLCVPSYNNNIGAQHADEKTGWMPGRIPAPIFRKAVTMIGEPDQSKIIVEELTSADMYARYINKWADVQGCRKYDARIVRLKNIHFSGEYTNTSDELVACTIYQDTLSFMGKGKATEGDPEEDTNANVFAPTTTNIGFPQSRITKDASNANPILVSCSEYTRYAHYYLPSLITRTPYATRHFVMSVSDTIYLDTGVKEVVEECVDSVCNVLSFDYEAVVGSVSGVLSYFMDNAGYAASKYKWSISTESLASHKFVYTKDAMEKYKDNYVFKNDSIWVPVEFSQSNFWDIKYETHTKIIP